MGLVLEGRQRDSAVLTKTIAKVDDDMNVEYLVTKIDF